MSQGVLILTLCLAVGLAGRNQLIVASCATLLLLRLAHLDGMLRWVLRSGVNLGVLILIVALLAPLADEQISFRHLLAELGSVQGVLAVVLAAAGAWLGRRGVDYLAAQPQSLVGLIVGSLLGTLLLRGVPTGPLILAGLTALLAGLFGK